MDYMLRSNTESDLDDALETAGLLIEQDIGGGELVLMPVAGCYVDRIGAIPAKLDPEGEVIRPSDTRFHANIRVTFELTPDQVDELPTFTPEPTIPYRVFA
jgi:hypothetical protein